MVISLAPMSVLKSEDERTAVTSPHASTPYQRARVAPSGGLVFSARCDVYRSTRCPFRLLAEHRCARVLARRATERTLKSGRPLTHRGIFVGAASYHWIQ